MAVSLGFAAPQNGCKKPDIHFIKLHSTSRAIATDAPVRFFPSARNLDAQARLSPHTTPCRCPAELDVRLQPGSHVGRLRKTLDLLHSNPCAPGSDVRGHQG